MSMFVLAAKSILNRRFTVLLTVFSIALSIMLLLAVERLRAQAQESFANTISGTDLIVGARSGSVQLLLYSVFRIGDATNNISWQSYEHVAADKRVACAVPLSMGDSHRGFRVLATNADYFVHYRYARAQHLELAQGEIFFGKYDAVIGADVARELNYKIGQEMILAHGTGEVSFADHADKPFHIVGILRKTGTPVDRTVHITLGGLDAMHEGWESGAAPVANARHADHEDEYDHAVENEQDAVMHPEKITAMLVGLNSKLATFGVQRDINEYSGEPLLAIMPGVALQSLWDTLAIAQHALRVISILVVLVGISGMITVMLASLNERRREMAILRSVGARPSHIFALIVGESAVIMLCSVIFGMILLYGLQALAQPIIQNQLGLFVPLQAPTLYEFLLLATAMMAGVLASMIPAWRAYRYSLVDGMTIRI